MGDWVERQLGNYQLKRLLGEGGFAEVYLGEHVHLGTRAAIKVLHTQLGGEDIDKFRTEARTIARLLHPNIVRVLDFGVEGKTPFLVMDFAPKGTLRDQYARGKPVPLPTVVSYVKQVAEALQCAHDEKLVHRDVKPVNMLIGRRGEILLSDFGIAIASQTSRQSTQDITGTVSYMAPEQIQGKPRSASDQYSLGIAAYEWLTGDVPFHGSFTEIVVQHVAVPPPPLREKVPSISPDVERVIMIALEKDPQKRFGSIQAFANALEQASKGDVPASEKPQETPAVLAPTVVATPVRATGRSLPPTQYVENTVPVRRNIGTIISTYRGHSERINSIAWSSDGKRLVCGSDDKSASVWAISTGKNIMTFHEHSGWINSVTPSPDNTYIATGSEDKTLQIWKTGNEHETIVIPYKDVVRTVAWSPDGRRIASAGYKDAFIWEVSSLRLIGYEDTHSWGGTSFKPIIYTGSSATINAISWSPDGRWLALASNDKTVSIWNTSTGHKVLVCRGHSHWVLDLAWSPNNLFIASASRDKTVRVWNSTTGECTSVYRNHLDGVLGVDWSPNEKYIVFGSHDCTVHVWNVITGQDVIVQKHAASVQSVSWSPDGRYIASGGDDKIVQVWVAPQ